MALFTKHSLAATLLLLALLIPYLYLSEAKIGVCYGRNGSNLPPAQEVINLYKSRGITRMRIYEPDHNTLEALRGSDIELVLGVDKNDLKSLGDDASAASLWVQNHVVHYANNVKFRYIVVGNEIKYTDQEARSILPAMHNIHHALEAANLAGQIKVTTAIDTSLVKDHCFPPSTGVFKSEAAWFINPIIHFLRNNASPLLVNIYPYFAYTQSDTIKLKYAIFTQEGIEFTDKNNGLPYRNLFDAMLDTVYAAVDKVRAPNMDNAGAPNMDISVSESGWSSGSDGSSAAMPTSNAATPSNAATYYQNLINHVKQGSPRKPGPIETYLFELFDENGKQPGPEQHFGLFYPDMNPKYQLSFN